MTTLDRIKRRYTVSRILAIGFAMIAVVFAMLFAYERSVTQSTYAAAYTEAIENSAALAEKCVDNTFDYDEVFRELTAELNICRETAVLTQKSEDYQRNFNEIYSACIKLPRQVRLYIAQVADALGDISRDEQAQGHQKLRTAIDKFDTLDYGANE